MLTLVLIFLGYSGLGISLWPNIIPPSISIWAAAAPPQSQGFALVGALFITWGRTKCRRSGLIRHYWFENLTGEETPLVQKP